MSRNEKITTEFDNGVMVILELSGHTNVHGAYEVIKGVIVSPLSLNLSIGEVLDHLDTVVDTSGIDHGKTLYVPLTDYTRTEQNNIVRHFIK